MTTKTILEDVVEAAKPRHEMSLDEMIRDSGWFQGTAEDWQELPADEREKMAFDATGCAVAFATWAAPVNCVHLRCRILRGELPKIAETNAILRMERADGWLRFMEDRSEIARIFRYYRKAARATGIYDPWKLDWKTMVCSSL